MKQKILPICIGLLLTGSAVASPFYLDPGAAYGDTAVDGGVDADSKTGSLDELGYSGTLFTSIYQLDGAGNRTGVVTDTNIKSVIDAAIGTTLPSGFVYPSSSEMNLDSLNKTLGTAEDTENFSGSPAFWGVDLLGGQGWGLTYEYAMTGFGTEAGSVFTDGFFNIFFQGDSADVNDGAQVLRLDVSGSSFTADTTGFTININGFVTYDFNANGLKDEGLTAFQKNFFNDFTQDKSFFDIWDQGGILEPMNISFKIDTNLTADQQNVLATNVDIGAAGDAGDIGAVRQTRGDGSVIFAVPAPAPLALMGIGLLALGLRRRA